MEALDHEMFMLISEVSGHDEMVSVNLLKMWEEECVKEEENSKELWMRKAAWLSQYKMDYTYKDMSLKHQRLKYLPDHLTWDMIPMSVNSSPIKNGKITNGQDETFAIQHSKIKLTGLSKSKVLIGQNNYNKNNINNATKYIIRVDTNTSQQEIYPPNGYANAVKQGKPIHQTVTSSSNNINATNHPTHPSAPPTCNRKSFLGLGSSNHKTLKTTQTGQKVIQNKGLCHSVNNIPIVYQQGKGICPNAFLRQNIGQNVNQINHLHVTWKDHRKQRI